MSTDNTKTAASAAQVTGENHDDLQDITAVVGVAQQVATSIKTLGLHGKSVPSTKACCSAILESTDTATQRKAAANLAATLSTGNDTAKKHSADIRDALQLKLPGLVRPAVMLATETSSTAGPQAPTAPLPVPRVVESRMVKVADIKIADTFKALFAPKPATVQLLTDDMKRRGFDPAHRIVIWAESGELVDGHCRKAAAEAAGTEEIPAVLVSFATEDDAIEYAIHTQCARRNLSDADILCLVEQLDRLRARGGDRRSAGASSTAPSGAVERSSEETAGKIGVSARTVERARRVIKSEKPDIIASVKAGTTSINKAQAQLKPKKRVSKVEAGDAGRAAVKNLNRIVRALQKHDSLADIRKKIEDVAADIELKVSEIEKAKSDEQ